MSAGCRPEPLRAGEVELARDVMDHQLVDTDGARGIRASDLYLARVAGVVQLVGVDVAKLQAEVTASRQPTWHDEKGPVLAPVTNIIPIIHTTF